ncbi:DEAD/DEAH box helicase [Clostridium sp.]|uniref:DEAD/DEAH box helicase n=1 Tax=Clostridium sp. TaxID=1506 RepID=UPI003993B1A1
MKAKDFQEATAQRIFEVFKEEGQNRVLLADEVGLGKTIIAKTVIEKVAQWHKDDLKDDFFKVVYICSNANIAKQNSRKLGIPKENCVEVSQGRLSMQHIKIYMQERENHDYMQLIPLTPITSFVTAKSSGSVSERALMYALLRRMDCFKRMKGFKEFMSNNTRAFYDWAMEYYEGEVIQCNNMCNYMYIPEMLEALNKKISPEIIEKIRERSKWAKVDKRYKNNDILTELRIVFAQISLDKLQPDLVIMDEFQNFRQLLHAESETGMIVEKFLKHDNTKVLLLSATPYKPYSTIEEISENNDEEHYVEFMQVMDFLFTDEVKQKEFKTVWSNYSNKLVEFKNKDYTTLRLCKNKAEDAMYQGVCRTERFNVNKNGIIDDSQAREVEISEGDIMSYIKIQSLLKDIRASNIPIDYVKSCPYLLSFMNQYKQKREIVNYFNKHKDYSLLNKRKDLFLNRNQIQRYKEVSINNARLQYLKEMLFQKGKNGFEKLLWIPPSKPYYITNSLFDKNANASKILVFSSWEMVPKMIAGMISYEAERLTVGKLYNNEMDKIGKGYFVEDTKRKFLSPRLTEERAQTLTLASKALADMFNPLEHIDKNIKDIRVELEKKVAKKLNEIKIKYAIGESQRGDVSWYVNAPLLWDGENLEGNHGNMPKDAAKVITNMIIGSPAVCGMRMFNDKEKAEKLGESFVSLFNKPESIAAVELLYGKRSEKTYYKNVLAYLVDGNIQAVLDEYAHTLGVKGEDLLKQISEGMKLKTSTLEIDTYDSFVERGKKSRLRTHFAVGYYNARDNEDNIQRTENIRTAFNSPFRPFVLATTSIGQEGLDFHLNCRKIMHWNLPANPIDLEQREGRINRFKCLAIRQNIAKKYGNIKFKEDVWEEMFNEASKKEKGNNSDLVPYWSLANTDKDTIKIERIVPMYPMSKDQVKYNKLIKVLSLYRLTLGQPRQEELINALGNNFNQIDDIEDLFINLSPFRRKMREVEKDVLLEVSCTKSDV